MALRLGLRDLQQSALVVLEAGNPRRFLRRRRYAVDLEGTPRLSVLNAELSGRGCNPASWPAAFGFRGNLPGNPILSLRLCEPDPLGNLLVPLQGREVSPVLELASLANAHAPDVLDTVWVDEAAPLNVADFLDVDRRRGAVDRLARVVAIVGRGDGTAGHDTAERAERYGAADPNPVAGLSRWQGVAEDESGQGACAAGPQERATHL